MNARFRDLLSLKGFLFLAGGGLVGLATSFLNRPLAILVGGIAALSIYYYWTRNAERQRTEAFQRLAAKAPSSPLVRDILAFSETAVDPLGSALEQALEKVGQQEGQAGASSLKSNASLESYNEILESLLREEEKIALTFHSFKEAVREWSSTIEKAGRINKSLLQLNELIVNDSKKVAIDTDEAAHSATDGIKSVGKEIKAMTEIKATIGSSAEVIQQLSRASDQIGEFLATITSIARKTNLLALNAGIEAARAGEHGQGFAVVASEIKILAEASAKASGDVKHLVDDIRSKTASAISLISTTGKIEENVNVVYNAGDVFMNIVKSIRKAGGLLGEISQALDDQRNDNELLLQLINKINVAGDQVRARFELAEQSLEQVLRLSQKLRAAVENLKV